MFVVLVLGGARSGVSFRSCISRLVTVRGSAETARDKEVIVFYVSNLSNCSLVRRLLCTQPP